MALANLKPLLKFEKWFFFYALMDRMLTIADKGTEIADKSPRIADKGTEIADKSPRIADKGNELADKSSRIAAGCLTK
ncbi:hypothetical protein [Lysinibacillus sp. RS5]|uniref:hypothetical protein n=1 Tax=unclassified Lysinibacillus TaxID=2636778 RepID=UPI0035BE90F4